MTIKDKLEEALIKEENFYISTPTYEIFEKVVNLFKNDFLEYVPYATFKYNNWNKNTWDKFGVTTNIYYIKSDKTIKFGNDVSKNDGYCLNLSNTQEKIQEHTYTISIGEYSGKLIIPKEALQLLREGTKIKIV